MKKLLKTIAVALFALAGTAASADAAVTAVTYRIAYNSTTCKYEVYMKVTAGSTTTGAEQEAYTSQVSIVVPNSATVTSLTSNEPQTGTLAGTTVTRTGTPGSWTQNPTSYNPIPAIAATGSTPAYTGGRVYAFTGPTSGAFFPVLATNDEVMLFSVSITPNGCGSGVRLWINNEIQGNAVTSGPEDPESINTGNNDYNNGYLFLDGSPSQAYVGNGTSTTTPPSPTATLTRSLIPGTSLTLNPGATAGSACATPLTYSLTGPNGFSSTSSSPVTISPISAANFGTYSLTVTDPNGCTALATTAVSLPVKLSGFDVTASKCVAELRWTTASELNFQHFDVQYSTDGSEFTTVGQVPGKRNEGGSAYGFSYNQAAGKAYYRLKMVDLDGSYAYSTTVALSTGCGSSPDNGVITVAPNPTTGVVRIAGIHAGDQVRILDMVGQVVSNTTATAGSTTVDLSPYPAGIYSVHVNNNHYTLKISQITKK